VRSFVSGLDDLDARPSARRMLALLDPAAETRAEGFRLLDDLSQTVLEACRAGSLLLILEDMHWADRSTQDFVAALARTARGRLLLVLTFRSDALHRRHPFRGTLAEIGRTLGARRVDLGPLERESIAGIVAARTGGPPDPAVVASVLARSEGNPLYAEELLNADRESVPGHLSDLLLARIDALGTEPRRLLRVASVNGTRLDTDTLAELAGVDTAEMGSCLREALDANVLRSAGDYLEFRHGLLREAAYDDLLPDERTRLHGDLAEILQAGIDAEPEPGLAALSRGAFHWHAAHDLPRTLATSVRAGLAAKRAGTAEAVTHLERALSLWDRVPDAEGLAGHARAELVVLLAEAANDQGDKERWHALVREAVRLLRPDTEPLLASRVYSALGDCYMLTDETVSRQEAVRLAIEHAGSRPSEELARALFVESAYLMAESDWTGSLGSATKAAEVARSVGAPEALAEALRNAGVAAMALGRCREGIALGREAVEVWRHAGFSGRAIYDTGNVAWFGMVAGQVEDGLEVARQGYEEGLALGLPVQAAMCGEQMQTALTWLGRLDESELLLAQLHELGIPEYRWRWQRVELWIARGEAEAAAPLLPEMMNGFRDQAAVLVQVQVAEMLDELPVALEAASTCLAQSEKSDTPLDSAVAARIGFHALALTGSMPQAQAKNLSALSTRHLGVARAGLTDDWRASYDGVQLALAAAYSARVAGEPAVAQFRHAVALAEPFGAFFALEPRLNLAEELLAHGGRDEGRELLTECWRVAHEMGARYLEERAYRLATRTRVPLPEKSSQTGPLSLLTPRECEVLDLLATGATNKAIAGKLFISEKTASVHVSRVLHKLGVENRGEAAALARRLLG
jgi:DNA-binding CsgD family transcriptional regulator